MHPAHEANETDVIYAQMLFAWAKRVKLFEGTKEIRGKSTQHIGFSVYQLAALLKKAGRDSPSYLLSGNRPLGKFISRTR